MPFSVHARVPVTGAPPEVLSTGMCACAGTSRQHMAGTRTGRCKGCAQADMPFSVHAHVPTLVHPPRAWAQIRVHATSRQHIPARNLHRSLQGLSTECVHAPAGVSTGMGTHLSSCGVVPLAFVVLPALRAVHHVLLSQEHLYRCQPELNVLTKTTGSGPIDPPMCLLW